jgi:hypothetical protein
MSDKRFPHPSAGKFLLPLFTLKERYRRNMSGFFFYVKFNRGRFNKTIGDSTANHSVIPRILS